MVALAWLPAAVVSADEIATGVFVRTDSDGTTVVSPRVRGRATVIDDVTTVDAAYAADIWTSASIDVRTAATRAVTEQRDELDVSIARELEDTTIRASYRLSVESDYTSHGGSVGATRGFADNSATVAATLSAAYDSVERSGDLTFSRPLSTVGGRVAYTQILDPDTLLQGAYEIERREGYQASPYRFVGVGGDGDCAGTAQLCVPEAHPSLRVRHAFVLRGRRAFGEALSAGASYRLYVDDWGLLSHTLSADAAYIAAERTTLRAGYRFYTQSRASFYLPRYPMPAGEIRLISRDRELSAMSDHRLSIAVEHALDLSDAGPTLRLTLAGGVTYLAYSEFVGLDHVVAWDATVAAVVEL